MEVEFSIKLDIEAGTILPMVAKTTTGGQFNVKFKWNIKPAQEVAVGFEKKGT